MSATTHVSVKMRNCGVYSYTSVCIPAHLYTHVDRYKLIYKNISVYNVKRSIDSEKYSIQVDIGNPGVPRPNNFVNLSIDVHVDKICFILFHVRW